MSGEGEATLFQIACASGYTERTTRAALKDLEALGLIEWDRGGIYRGKPIPSFFRIVKKKLVALIRNARRELSARETAHYLARDVRLKQDGKQDWTKFRMRATGKIFKGRYERRSEHAEMISALFPSSEGSIFPSLGDSLHPDDRRRSMEAEINAHIIAQRNIAAKRVDSPSMARHKPRGTAKPRVRELSPADEAALKAEKERQLAALAAALAFEPTSA
jgi:hypothetical protein